MITVLTMDFEGPMGFFQDIHCSSLQPKVECNFYSTGQSLQYDLEVVPLMTPEKVPAPL